MNPTWSVLRTLVYAILWLAVCAWRVPAMAAEPVDFVRDVRPILAAHCFDCHGDEKQESGLRLDAAAGLVAGGNSGPAIVAGQERREHAGAGHARQGRRSFQDAARRDGERSRPSRSRCWRAGSTRGRKCPTKRRPAAARRTSDHWSFQPLARPATAGGEEPGWVRNPIDAFVLAQLEAAGLAPSPEAEQGDAHSPR